MKIIFDQNVPFDLCRYLSNHDVRTAEMLKWDRLTNGELLRVAEEGGFETFITCDQSLRYQQNLAARRIAIVEISLAHWPSIQSQVSEIVAVIESSVVGDYRRVECPYMRNKKLRKI